MFPSQWPERELLMTGLWRGSRLRWRRGRGARRDRGSMSVELAVIAPGLILLLLLVGAGGRVVEAQGHVDGAARDAARSASLARSLGQADALARQAAQADLGSSSWCAQGTVTATVAGFPAVGQAVVPGTNVTVTVGCDINTSPFTILGFNPTTAFTAQAVAPLDPYMCRTGTC
jgi:Flp pilus assembly protein TadG